MNLIEYIKKIKWVEKLISHSKEISFFGMQNVSIYEIITIYTDGIQKATLSNRAAAISWRLFLGMFPFMLFFLVLLQFMPHYEFIEKYIYESLLEHILPPNLVDTSKEYFSLRSKQIAETSEGNVFAVISFSVLTYLYFATNGTRSLIDGLKSKTLESDKMRSASKEYIIALIFTIFFAVLMLASLTVLYYTEIIWKLMSEINLLKDYDLSNIRLLKFAFFVLMFFIGISVLYYKGPKNKLTYREVLPGTYFTTFLFLFISYFFGIIVTKFGQYNILYGSVGSVMILMITIYIDVILILLGYELNIAIKKAKQIETI